MTSSRMRVLGLCLLLTGVAPVMGHAEAIVWPEAVARLAGERTKAETCIAALKRFGNEGQIARGRVAYGTAKAEFDAAIAGLIVVLGQDDKPESLATLNAKLEQGALGLKQFCDGVLPLLPPDEGRGDDANGIIGLVPLPELDERTDRVYLEPPAAPDGRAAAPRDRAAVSKQFVCRRVVIRRGLCRSRSDLQTVCAELASGHRRRGFQRNQ